MPCSTRFSPSVMRSRYNQKSESLKKIDENSERWYHKGNELKIFGMTIEEDGRRHLNPGRSPKDYERNRTSSKTKLFHEKSYLKKHRTNIYSGALCDKY